MYLKDMKATILEPLGIAVVFDHSAYDIVTTADRKRINFQIS